MREIDQLEILLDLIRMKSIMIQQSNHSQQRPSTEKCVNSANDRIGEVKLLRGRGNNLQLVIEYR